MLRRFLKVCILSGIAGGISLALWVLLIFIVGGLIQKGFWGIFAGLLGGLPFFLILAFYGILIGLPTGLMLGLCFRLVDVGMAAVLPTSPRRKVILASVISFSLSFLIYFRWLMSQGPLVEMN